MVSTQSNGFVPEVYQRFKDFAEGKDLGLRFSRTLSDLDSRLRRCESPIEQILLIEITRVMTEYELSQFCIIMPQIWAYYTDEVRDSEVRVVGVRLDLLICFRNNLDFIDSSHARLWPPDQRPSLLPLFAVECDGREFHTHEAEIQRDKVRDRVLTSLGLTTIRFTGSEIFNDPLGSAWEVFNLFVVRFRDILESGANRAEFIDFNEAPLMANMKHNSPPPLVQFKKLFLSERKHEELLRYDVSNINDDDARRLGLLKH